MAETTGIAWSDATFNGWIGCTKVGPGCDHCYASVSTAARALGVVWGAGQQRRRTSESNWRKPLRWNDLAAKGFMPDGVTPLHWGKRPRVFCASLADVFDNEVPDEWRVQLWGLIENTPNLDWLLLTKRIGNVAKMLPSCRWGKPYSANPYPNAWLGATIVNQEEADRDIPKLLSTPAAKRFVSYEPALGPVDWRDPPNDMGEPRFSYLERVDGEGPRIDWIIVGGESAQPGYPARPFDIQWARDTVRQCREAGVAVFVKQLGSNTRGWCLGNGHGEPEFYVQCQAYEASENAAPCPEGKCACRIDRAGADPMEWPNDLRIREFPNA